MTMAGCEKPQSTNRESVAKSEANEGAGPDGEGEGRREAYVKSV